MVGLERIILGEIDCLWISGDVTIFPMKWYFFVGCGS